MRYYISGAVTNNPRYIEDFNDAETTLKAMGYDVINPVTINEILLSDFKVNTRQLMSLDFRLIDLCDGIYMLKSWEKSCGAHEELGYAIGKDKEVIYER